MRLKASFYERDGAWYFSCCGAEWGPFPNRGQAEAAARLHEFSH